MRSRTVRSRKPAVAAVVAMALTACLACLIAAAAVLRYRPPVVAAPGHEMRWPTRPGLRESLPKRVRALFELGRPCDYTVLGWDVDGLLFYQESCQGRRPQVWAYDPEEAARPRAVEVVPNDLFRQTVPRSSILEWVRSPGVRPADAEPMVRNLKVRVDGLASPDGRWVAVVVGHIYGPEDVIVLSTPKPTPILPATAAPPPTQPPATAGVDGDKVVFTIPVGPEGVQYGAEQTGPMALAVAPDSTFWIADTQGNRLLHYDRQGVLLNRIDLNGYGAYGAADVEPVGSDILVLCSGRVLRLTAGGDLLAAYDIPPGLGPEGGLTGLAVGDHGQVMVEFEMGAEVAQLVDAQGVLDPLPLPGYTHEGRLYGAQLAGRQASHGFITAGNTRIEIVVPNTLAGLRILGFTPAGGFYVVVEEMVSTPAVRVDQTVRLYGPAGELLGLARVPVAEQTAYVQNGLAVGPDGCVYALLTRPDQVEVVRLSFSTIVPVRPSASPARQPEIVSKGILDCVPAGAFSRCVDEVLNIAFEYPSDWGEIETVLRTGGYAGYAYDYHFGRKTHAETEPLVAGGRSADFSEGRGAMPTDFGGYEHPGWQGARACDSRWSNWYPLCHQVSDHVAWMIRFPNASALCEDVLGNWQTMPVFRIEINLPDNPTINGFVFEAPFFSEQFAGRVQNDLYPLLGARLDWRASKCDESSRRAFDAQLMTLIESITDRSADAETLQNVDELVHLAESIAIRQSAAAPLPTRRHILFVWNHDGATEL